MTIGQINQRALGTNSVDGDAIINGEVTANHLHTSLDLSTKTVTLPQASVTAHQGNLVVTTSQISDISIDTVLNAGATTNKALTVGDLTATGNVGGSLVSQSQAIAFSIALG